MHAKKNVVFMFSKGRLRLVALSSLFVVFLFCFGGFWEMFDHEKN